jgi:hypothetical protein
MEPMRPLLLLLVLVAVAACGPSQEQEQAMTQCHKAYTQQNGVKNCMIDNGYHFNPVLRNCGTGDAYGDATCYTR